MFVKQISVVLKNIPGMLADLSEILGEGGVNIRAISVADTSEINTVRIVVDDPEKAINILKGRNYSAYETDVLAVEMPDHPGGISAVARFLKDADINILCLYSFLGRVSNQAILILGVDRIEEAHDVFQKNSVHTIGKELYNM